ncbi:MAG: hypothetical protein ABL931_13685 [Usitatibacteraceae bacterium]
MPASEVEHGLLGLISSKIEALHADGLLQPQAVQEAAQRSASAAQ